MKLIKKLEVTAGLESKVDSLGNAFISAENKLGKRHRSNIKQLETLLKDEVYAPILTLVNTADSMAYAADSEYWRLYAVFEIARYTHGRIASSAGFSFDEPGLTSDDWTGEVDEAIRDADEPKEAVDALRPFFKREITNLTTRIKYFESAEKRLNTLIKSIIQGTPA